jgi:hypothetical protein
MRENFDPVTRVVHRRRFFGLWQINRVRPRRSSHLRAAISLYEFAPRRSATEHCGRRHNASRAAFSVGAVVARLQVRSKRTAAAAFFLKTQTKTTTRKETKHDDINYRALLA